MKWLPALFCILLSCVALADDGPKPVPVRQGLNPPNVTIVNGKRFYSLQNVRRFTGGVDSPRALSVMHHPRPLGTVTGPRGASLPLTRPESGTGMPLEPADKDKVLSIFAPDDKSAPPAAR